MSGPVIPVHMPEAMLHDATQQAAQSGASVEEWLLAIAAENIRHEQVAKRFYRPSQTDEEAGKVMLHILHSTRNNPVTPGDELND